VQGQRPFDRRRVDVAHEPPDVLTCTRQCWAPAQALRFEQGLEQMRRQIESLQLLRLERQQMFAQPLQRLGFALARRAAGALRARACLVLRFL
jgi:hypothetical protein